MAALDIIRRRLHRQRLFGSGFTNVAEAVSFHGALQAQEYAEAKWSLAQRVPGLTEADVEEAMGSGAILRTHVLRPTWHFVTAQDIRWLQRLTAPRVHQLNGHYYRQLRLDDDMFARAEEVIAAALEPGEPLTRKELAAALVAGGIDTLDNLRTGYLMIHAELECVLASGPRRGKQQTYRLLDAPEPPHGPEDDLRELAVRYFTSHGPATVADFAWWSSLTVTHARAGIAAAGDTLRCEIDDGGTEWWSAAGLDPVRAVSGARLLGTYDETVVAYRTLRYVPEQENLLVRPLVVDGRTVGTWKRPAGATDVDVTPFADAGADQISVEAELERYRAFFGLA